ncbi:hypothetical protein [Chryseobacterium sp. JM1]|uniref:hypothetical protein n=1 Tax=Chryseobacterium sp. JM1 TaxID=1233950 RepID=UPI0004E6CE89|nr:hypothetical protein [Chryseobacterium sp. JM1]KFF22919.1 hypothetical protein IW22_01350 [Chryseobacterium sp. JM1]
MWTLLKIPDAAIGAIIAAIIGAGISILTILTKDFWFPILTEKRSSKAKRRQTFRKYANPLMMSSVALLYRIKEIFFRGYFLLDVTPKNFYNNYKYVSSVYRILALIGWIRASKIELSHIEVDTTDDYQQLEKAITGFEKSLADGEHIEQSILENLAKHWNLKIDKLQSEQRNKLGVDIEKAIDELCFKENVEIALNLSDEGKKCLAKEVCHLICTTINSPKIDIEVINETVKTVIREMSRVEAWIFRDWQSALGDMMIKKASNDTDRKFEVIGFKEFEQIYFSEEPEDKKWIERIDRLFKNLDVSIDDRFDARTQQFRNIYNATYNLLEAYSKVKTSNIHLTANALKDLKQL